MKGQQIVTYVYIHIPFFFGVCIFSISYIYNDLYLDLKSS